MVCLNLNYSTECCFFTMLFPFLSFASVTMATISTPPLDLWPRPQQMLMTYPENALKFWMGRKQIQWAWWAGKLMLWAGPRHKDLYFYLTLMHGTRFAWMMTFSLWREELLNPLKHTHTPIKKKKKKPRYFPPCTLTVWPQTANNPITTSFITFQSYRVWIEVWVQYHELFLFHYQKCIHKCTPFYTICYVQCYLKLVVLFSSIKKSI